MHARPPRQAVHGPGFRRSRRQDIDAVRRLRDDIEVQVDKLLSELNSAQ
jgi:hypothetical protein